MSLELNKRRLDVFEEEYGKLLPLVAGVMGMAYLTPAEEAEPVEVSSFRYAFRLLLIKYITEAIFRCTKFSNIEELAVATGNPAFSTLSSTVDSIVKDLFEVSSRIKDEPTVMDLMSKMATPPGKV